MRLPAWMHATEKILAHMIWISGVFKQIANVLCLPAIRRYVLCRPKDHWGYGFPIDSVAAPRTQTPYEAATLPVCEAIAH
jgi:tRNA-splicing ligase RtcB